MSYFGELGVVMVKIRMGLPAPAGHTGRPGNFLGLFFVWQKFEYCSAAYSFDLAEAGKCWKIQERG